MANSNWTPYTAHVKCARNKLPDTNVRIITVGCNNLLC